eukprot:3593594-Rhodomonas_salina.2
MVRESSEGSGWKPRRSQLLRPSARCVWRRKGEGEAGACVQGWCGGRSKHQVAPTAAGTRGPGGAPAAAT